MRWKEYCEGLYSRNTRIPATCMVSEDTGTEPPPLLEEVREAINELKQGKSPGDDEITAELIKNCGEPGIIFYHKLCTKIWEEKLWPQDWVNSVFIPIPKKGDTLQCCNNRTIALISHSSKIILKIIAKRLGAMLEREIAVEQAGFRPGRGTRNQILNLKLVIEKNREKRKNLYLCFIDYTKAFDMVMHDRLWADMLRLGTPTHIIYLLMGIYNEQKAKVRTSYGDSDWFTIEKGVRQGCIISPHLFNIYSECIMREALEGHEGTVKVGEKLSPTCVMQTM